jgi:hypothetical protein
MFYRMHVNDLERCFLGHLAETAIQPVYKGQKELFSLKGTTFVYVLSSDW